MFTVDLYKNGAVIQTGTAGGGGLASGIYGVEIRSNYTSVEVTLDDLTVSLTTSTKLPNFKPYTKLMQYHIVPTYGVQ